MSASAFAGERQQHPEAVRVKPVAPMELIGSHSGAFKAGAVKNAALEPDLPSSGRAVAKALRRPFETGGKMPGRAALSNQGGRFETHIRVPLPDTGDVAAHGLEPDEDWPSETLARTQVTLEKARSIITRNDSPDISFDRSINPYRGCEHGCIYCYARPSHAYMGLSPGLDFETRLFAKDGAAALLERELSAPGYKPKTIAIGANTDPYQPIEKQYRITRQVLEVLARFNHPVGIVTKSALVTRDIDILAPMARKGLVKVALSVTTLDAKLARLMEPRASAPLRRLDTIRQLAEAGIPASVMMAPIIPGLNDHEIEDILTQAQAAGAREAGYVMLRLPLEVDTLFGEWLLQHFPDRYRRIMSLVRDMRGGKTYDATFGKRMTGTGPHAWMSGRRFERACEKLGLNANRLRLRTDLFAPPPQPNAQLSLF